MEVVTHSRLKFQQFRKRRGSWDQGAGFEYDSLAVPSSENIIERRYKIKLVDTIYYDSNQQTFVLENGTSFYSLSGLSALESQQLSNQLIFSLRTLHLAI